MRRGIRCSDQVRGQNDPPQPRSAKRVQPTQDRETARRRRRIEALEEKIAAQEKRIETIENRLWEEALDLGPVESRNLAREKTELREELERLVEEWAKLSDEKEPAGSTLR